MYGRRSYTFVREERHQHWLVQHGKNIEALQVEAVVSEFDEASEQLYQGG